MSQFTVYAPGRAELLGNHTDYNEGYVMAIAVDRGITGQISQSADKQIVLNAQDLNETYSTTLSSWNPEQAPVWSRYVLGVARLFEERGISLPGFNFSFSSTLPMGAGLSSSAALEIATANALQALVKSSLSKIEIAKIGQKAEHQAVGVKCGLLDQISSAMSRKGHVTCIDCRTLEVTWVPVPDGVSFVISNSNVKHALVSGEYNERRESCEAAAKALGVPFLRDASMSLLDSKISSLTTKQAMRARHIIGENDRVIAGKKALQSNDAAAFGKLMFESHESSIHNFENSCEELDTLVKIARTIPGCLGSRLSGGGFGGATISLVKTDAVDAFIKAITSEFPQAICLTTSAADGAK